MARARSKKIELIVFVVLTLAALTQNACVQANWARIRIRRGMTAGQALQVSGGWIWGNAESDDPALDPPIRLPFNHALIWHGQKERQEFASLEDVAESLQQQMMGHPWWMSLTYLGTGRPVFTVFLDNQGKVQAVSQVALAQR